MIRTAVPADLPRLTEIYNHYVQTSHVTFDDVAFTDRTEWFSHYGTAPHWLLVAEVDGQVSGYASSSPYRPKPGYRTDGSGPGFAPAGEMSGWAPGMEAYAMPEGTARLLPKGARIVMETAQGGSR